MCERIGNVIVCGRRSGKTKPCEMCGRPGALLLCDGPLPEGIVHRRSAVAGADRTCSRSICGVCATRRGSGDYCDRDACQARAGERLAL